MYCSCKCYRFLLGQRPSIKPDTITSFGPVKMSAEKEEDTTPVGSQDAVVPSSTKKLTSRMNQSDKVLTYLKASVSTHSICVESTQLVTMLHWVGSSVSKSFFAG